jgi:Fe-S-cluster containining protein
MPEVEIDKKTRWECQRCGECCRGIILSMNKNLSVVKEGKIVCKFFDFSNSSCLNYNERPFICKLYPFVIELHNIVEGDAAKPEKAFLLGNMKIHFECPGYGKGRRIFGNKNLQRKFEKLGEEFAFRFKECFEEGGDITKIM